MIIELFTYIISVIFCPVAFWFVNECPEEITWKFLLGVCVISFTPIVNTIFTIAFFITILLVHETRLDKTAIDLSKWKKNKE